MPDAEPPSGPPPPVATAEPGLRSRLILTALSRAESRRRARSWIEDGLVAASGVSVVGLSLVRIFNDDLRLSQAFSAWAQSALLLGVYVLARCADILMSAKALDDMERDFAEEHGKEDRDENRLRELAGRILPASEALAARRSATLFGAAGGAAAMIAGEVLAQLAPAMGTQPLRWTLTILGIMLAHAVWRSRHRLETERRSDFMRARREALTAQIGEVRKLLAGERKSNPFSLQVIEELERQHLDLIRELGEVPLPEAEPGGR